jgi:putative ubiquitin-RnfH superfamily antitoxin RatB of RatAB toxin-antitoxin module
MAELIPVEVAYATPERQLIMALEVPAGTTALEAIDLSGIRDEFPEMVVDERALGVFSRKIKAEYIVQPGDRIEIYRPLIADPKEIRRQRARMQG